MQSTFHGKKLLKGGASAPISRKRRFFQDEKRAGRGRVEALFPQKLRG
jgi:hypothetical protein